MPSLQVRELPENIYNLLQKQAIAEHRSLAQEAVIVLAKGLNTSISNKTRREKLLNSIKTNQTNEMIKQIDPIEFIKEDRRR
ncbi:MAG: hypothetical protein KZQ83_20510 [gamma proteobacterium symbiont of Taylorina sp.]|nr:hypothetical protein [gamma proteobacterium symbiont of Taylorina sp.]